MLQDNNKGTQGIQEFFFVCELKSPRYRTTQCTLLNSHGRVNPKRFFGYDVQRKKEYNFFHLRIFDVKPTILTTLTRDIQCEKFIEDESVSHEPCDSKYPNIY